MQALDGNLEQSEYEIRIPAKKEQKLLRTMILKKGHSLFGYDTQTGELFKVLFDKSVAVIGSADQKAEEVGIRHKVTYDPRIIYMSALNKKNAIKKLKQIAHEKQLLQSNEAARKATT